MKKGKLGLLSVSLSMVTALFAGAQIKENHQTFSEGGVPDNYDPTLEVVKCEPAYNCVDEYYDWRNTNTAEQGVGLNHLGDILKVWDKTKGEGTRIAIIDSGIDADHPDFKYDDGTCKVDLDCARYYANVTGTSSGYTVEYIKDESSCLFFETKSLYKINGETVSGKDVVAHKGDTSHGTNTASTAASAVNPYSKTGCIGIAPKATIVPIKVDMYSNSILEALKYIHKLNTDTNPSNNIDVVNISIVGYGLSSSYYNSATSDLINDKTIVVASAGNDKKSDLAFPAADRYVIGVGALEDDSSTDLASYSNFNSPTQTQSTLSKNTDLVAPGKVYCADYNSGSTYKHNHGTSFASPIVAGAACLWKSLNKTGTVSSFKDALLNSCVDIGDSGWDAKFGKGRLDIGGLIGVNDIVDTSSVSLNDVTVKPSETVQLTPTISPTNATSKDYLWWSDSTSVATVDENGLVSGVKEGTAVIHCKSMQNDNAKDTCTVTVSNSTSGSGTTSDITNPVTFTFGSDSNRDIQTQSGNVTKSKVKVTANGDGIGATCLKVNQNKNNAIKVESTDSTAKLISVKLSMANDSQMWSSSNGTMNGLTWTSASEDGVASVSFSKGSGSGVKQSQVSSIEITLKTNGTSTSTNYTVSFNSNGGSGTMTSATTNGSSYAVPACTFTKANYEFDKWALNSTSGTQYSVGDTITGISSNITLYATWKQNQTTGGGEGSDTETSTKYLFTNSKWNPWTSIKDGVGYNNSGVQVTANGTGANANSTKSFNNVKKAIVTYCTNSSSGAGTITVKIGSTKLGSFNVTTSGGTTARTNEITGTAALSGVANISVSCSANSIYVCGIEIFEGGSGDTPTPTPTNYTVSFNSNGGSGTMADATTNGSSYVAPACTFTKANYEFDRWALGSTTGVKYSVGDTITGISSNITLYATWSPKETPNPDFGDYYKSITATSGMTLLGQLHTLMAKTHDTYTSYSHCSDPTYIYFTDPGSTIDYVTDFYTQKDIGVDWGAGGVGTWNREHVWCQSLSVSESTGTQLWGTTYGGSDLQHVRPVESTLNSSRNNNPFGVLSDFGYNKNNYKTYAQDKNKNTTDLGGYVVSKSPNFVGVFEPLDSAKGDVARILMYVYMHYSNQTTGSDSNTSLSGHTTDLSIRKIVNTSANTDQAAWDLLLAWNAADEVSEAERTRNNEAASVQGNRNPFIDHPEYAEAIWGSSTPVKVLDKIEVENPQTSYFRNDTFVKPSVIATYKDGTSVDVKDAATFTGFDSSTVGEETILVSYSENGINKETSYKINVSLPETTKITITRNSIGSMSNSYNWYAINEDGITGKAYSYPSNSGIQINGKSNSNKGIFTSNDYGYIKSIKIVKSSSTTSDREITIKGSNDKYSESNYSSGTELGSKVITTSGTTWTLEDNFKYISLYSSDSVIIESIEITYGLTPMDIVSKVTSISLDKTTQSFDLKDRSSFTLTPTVAYTGSPDTTVTWTSSNTSVATVSKSSGSKNEQITVTALCAGTATITATCGGIPASCTVEITDTREVVSSITVNPATLSLEEGQSSTLEATINGSNITTDPVVTWTSSNSSVATVDSSGTVNAVSVGNATISASYGGQSGSCAVTVTEKATPTPSGGYTLVTNASELSAGDQLLIVGIKNGVYYSLAPYASGNNCRTNEIDSPVNNSIDTEAAPLTLGGSTGSWTLFDGTYYLYAAGGTSNNYLKGQTTVQNDTAKWTISVDNDGKATIVCKDSSTTRNKIRFNSNGNNEPLFSCYSSGQNDIYIYRKTSGSVTPTPDKEIVSIELTSSVTSIIYGTNNGSVNVAANLVATYDDGSTGEITPERSNFVINSYKLGYQNISATYNGVDYYHQIKVTNNGAEIGDLDDITITGENFKKSMPDGWSQSGAGSDYANSNKPYLLKLDTTGAYFQYSPSDFSTSSQTIETTVNLKMLGGASSSSFDIKALVKDSTGKLVESSSIVGSIAISGSQNSVKSLSCTLSNPSGETIYGFRFIFNKGSNIGVAGATIAISGGVDYAGIERQTKAWSQYFLDLTSPICSANENGENGDALSSVWGELSSEFNYMGSAAKELFLTSNEGTIAEARQRYMHIASHYGVDIENLDKAQFANKKGINLFENLNVFDEEHPATFLTVVLSLVGVASIGGYFIIKKRKEI